MKKAIVTLLVVGVVGASAFAYYHYKDSGPKFTVATAQVTRGDIVDTVGATGTLQAVTTVQVGSQVSGTISHLRVDFNSLVKKGQVLARLDPSLFATHRFDLGDTMDAYDTFADAANSGALKVVLSNGAGDSAATRRVAETALA